MKAAVFDGESLETQSVHDPSINDSQVLVRVRSVGICGTDLAIIEGKLPTTIPIILGHEFTGDVIEVGKNVDPKWLNKRITSEINSNIDFNCFFCKEGKHKHAVSGAETTVVDNKKWNHEKLERLHSDCRHLPYAGRAIGWSADVRPERHIWGLASRVHRQER